MTNSRHIEAKAWQWRRVAAVSHADAAVDRPEHRGRPAGTVELRRKRGGFQASFTLLNSKFKGLVSALRGE
jgi:hypothetical protein